MPRFPRPVTPEQDRTRVNYQIRISPVRLVGPDGNQLGVVPVEEARAKAEELGLDLVEVNPNIRPVVCKIMDYGRFKYDRQKSAKKAKSAASELKQIKYRPNIDDHDFETKTAKLRRFLEQGNKVRVTLMFRRRDMRRPENGIKVMERVAEALSDVGKAEEIPRTVISRDLTMTIFPLKPASKDAKPEGAAKPAPESKPPPKPAPAKTSPGS
ncbi:MAG: translation initiation factor IF-3 [Acidobacteriota bacterium]